MREAIQALPMGSRNRVLSVLQQCYHYILQQEFNVIITTEEMVDNTELKNSRQTANVKARLSSQRQDIVTLESCLLDAIHFVNRRTHVQHSDTCTFQVIKSLQDTISEKDFEDIQKSSSLIHLVEVLKLLNQRNILLEEKTINYEKVIVVYSQLCLNLNYILTSMINKPVKEKEVFEKLLKEFSAAELSYRQEDNDKTYNALSKNLKIVQEVKKLPHRGRDLDVVTVNLVVKAINTQSARSIQEMQINLDLPTTKLLKEAAVKCKQDPTSTNKAKVMKLYEKLKKLYRDDIKESLHLEGPFNELMVKINERVTVLKSRRTFIFDDKEDTKTKLTHLLTLRNALLSLSKDDLSHPKKVKNLKDLIQYSLKGMDNQSIKRMKYPTVKRIFSGNSSCVSNTTEIFNKALRVAEQLNKKLSQHQTIIF